MMLMGIPSDVFPRWEQRLGGYFQSFEDRSGGSWNINDFRRWVLTKDAQCWVVMDGDEVKACGLTQIKTDNCKTCEAIACAGEDSEGWAALIDGVAEWAKAQGCGKFRLICRPGWERRLRGLGYKKTLVMLDKEI